MKKFTDKVHRLGQRATELKHMIESVPPKVVEIRDVVTTATTQVQKLRADIISSVSTLRAETDTQLLSALREIDGAADGLAEAGVRLKGVDMDLGPTRRLIVHLDREADLEPRRLHALHVANSAKPTVQALLAALLKAEELAHKVEFEHLRYTKLVVEVGLIPSVRIGWRTDAGKADAQERSEHPAAASTSAPAPAAAAHSPVMSAPSTFFAPRPSHQVEPAAKPAPVVALSDRPAEAKQPVALAAAQPHDARWRASALDRFKKMPDLQPSR